MGIEIWQILQQNRVFQISILQILTFFYFLKITSYYELNFDFISFPWKPNLRQKIEQTKSDFFAPERRWEGAPPKVSPLVRNGTVSLLGYMAIVRIPGVFLD